MKLILGSRSPRREALLAGLDIPFETVVLDVDEQYPSSLKAGDIPLYISRKKARAFANRLQSDELVVTADTIVWLEERMLGKPHTLEEAKRMLQRLSGKTHQVYTAVTFMFARNVALPVSLEGSMEEHSYRLCSFVDCTDVTFRHLTDQEIDYYVDTYHPLDKAGAYGIQEYIGYIGMEKIVGSYFNVMGFPIERVYLYLRQFGFKPTVS